MTFIRQWRQKTHSYKKQNGQETDRLTKTTVVKDNVTKITTNVTFTWIYLHCAEMTFAHWLLKLRACYGLKLSAAPLPRNCGLFVEANSGDCYDTVGGQVILAKRLQAITVHVRNTALSLLLAPAVLSRIQFCTLKQFFELSKNNSFGLSDVHASRSEPNWPFAYVRDD